ncbi:MAG: hypothetical protein AABZ34_10220 [Nitrospirota bacterium]
MNDSPLGHWALTGSRPSADVTLITLRVADLAAALRDELFAHPAGNSNMRRDLIVVSGAKVDFPAVF